MTLAYALAIAVLAACGVHMMLSRHAVRILFGVAVLSAAVNLVIFYAGRIASDVPPVILGGQDALASSAANPLPQALILTAIVIGFALVSFVAALALRLWRSVGTLDGRELGDAERLGTPFADRERRP
ncbi:cation:proton antiporter [Aureimonas flava]|uniref:Cation:proton antiporter n=1 Tax=Aureimonas flava TaxID=2320271 RepID=A0A3A1WEK0_9HYPH|nr:NADH-quinone oxidoreductase subunit K [Aureimonas flava]RIX97736.1 cation:proton antiporter [Aureimonas flava]